MPKHRVQIRFRKDGDLRMISHRDLARAFERLFRRAGVPLAMSQGFHPKAKFNFPSALSLGIRALDEVVEVDLAERIDADALAASLRGQLPPGLIINSVTRLPDAQKKAQPTRFTYEFPLPAARRPATQQAIDHLLRQSSLMVERAGSQPVDVRAGIESLQLDDRGVRFTLRMTRTASVRPREVLSALGLSDLEDAGHYLTRTQVDLAPPVQPERPTSDEEGNAD